MIELQVQLDAIKYVEKKLKELGTPGNAQAIAKKAVNETARRARKELIGKAKDSYTVKKKGRFNKEIKLKSATVGDLKATISGRGEPLPLNQFKISAGKKTTKAQVVKAGSLKELKRNSDGVKAFVNNIAEKGARRTRTTEKGEAGTDIIHNAVAQREGKERLHIKKLYSNSIPAMVGSRRVYGQKEDEIMEMLKDSLDRHIRLAMGD